MVRKSLVVFLFVILLSGCKSIDKHFSTTYLDIASIDTILNEKISIRAILPEKDKIWYAGDVGRYGFYDLSTKTVFRENLDLPSKPEFRSIAKTSGSVFILNAGSPALLYKISKDGSSRLVYKDENPKAFYDSMQFWNDKEGIAIGDPTENCLSVLITRDGGNSWAKIHCENLPKTVEGEAAFAASNTNVIAKGNKAWIASGGKKARVFYTFDKGNTWEVYETPIIKGGSMTGIFTADFYDDNIGVIAGGNYEMPQQNSGNKALTSDGGKTWKLVSENAGFGYASCIQFVPGSRGKELVSVGASGLYYSADGGLSWKQLLNAHLYIPYDFMIGVLRMRPGKIRLSGLGSKNKGSNYFPYSAKLLNYLLYPLSRYCCNNFLLKSSSAFFSLMIFTGGKTPFKLDTNFFLSWYSSSSFDSICASKFVASLSVILSSDSLSLRSIYAPIFCFLNSFCLSSNAL